ncbi:MAG TPA: hypothetical protein VFT79_02015 [Solirubrobacterales bacterium]|nr:hypothetical protein [Solirubrobacterales bacterium]
MIAAAQPDLDIVVDDQGWVRRRPWGTFLGSLFAAVNALFYGVLFGLGLGLGVAGSMVEKEPLAYLVCMAMFGGLAFLCARAAIRMLRAGVRISPEGVVVRGPLRTWSIGRTDAVRFVPGEQENGLLLCTYGALLERGGGRLVPIWGLRSIQPTTEEGLEEGRTRWQPVCDQLNDLLSANKGEAP